MGNQDLAPGQGRGLVKAEGCNFLPVLAGFHTSASQPTQETGDPHGSLSKGACGLEKAVVTAGEWLRTNLRAAAQLENGPEIGPLPPPLPPPGICSGENKFLHPGVSPSSRARVRLGRAAAPAVGQRVQ